MKKIVFFVLITAFAMVSFAKSDLKVKSGSIAFTKEQVKVCVQFDFSGARWDKDDDFKTWCGDDYETRLKIAKNSFIKGFNDKSKGAVVGDSKDGAKYRMVIKIDNMDWRQSMGMWGQMYVLCWGSIEVIDMTNGQSVCTIEIDGANGAGDFVPNDRFAKCFETVGETLAKMKK